MQFLLIALNTSVFSFPSAAKNSKAIKIVNAKPEYLSFKGFLVLMHWTLMRERSDILAALFRNRRSSIDNNKCQLDLRALRSVGKGGKGAILPPLCVEIGFYANISYEQICNHEIKIWALFYVLVFIRYPCRPQVNLFYRNDSINIRTMKNS